ncbi:hypothetical protein HYPSUDRAFT_71753 [Hypholoma sublateritium FD-334 SS-4]|uniref:Uncharacterized protein n=1 Tax=Hypholoma sublateritium (strain FD-334 SS-4) TaxID=945553 RepID=A0A0D2NGT3_HYPSF|nr:hypothetical protein HYPSUDRAFT_71753 [Hypholoma sublateritium FD-334 SS-4]
MAPPVQSDVDATSPESSDTENNVMLNINTSRADLLKIARQYQAEKNTARAELKILNRKLADITNDDDDSSHRPKRRKTRQISPPAGSDEEDTTDTSNRANEHFVYQAGHKFFLIYAPWLRSGDDLFDIDVNMRYNSAERFENDKNKSQGQLQEIINLLQAKFQSQALRQKWLRRQFINGLNAQRHNTASRIRHNCASILGVSETDLLKADVRKTKFREEIGWVSESGVYSSVDVPILHKTWGGEYALSSVFLNPKLMGVRWALSADETLQEVGSSTGIRYFSDYEEYLTIIETGLRQKKKSIINVIKQWDEKIFPETESSLVKGKKSNENGGLKKAMDLLAADSEEEDEEEAEDEEEEDEEEN